MSVMCRPAEKNKLTRIRRGGHRRIVRSQSCFRPGCRALLFCVIQLPDAMSFVESRGFCLAETIVAQLFQATRFTERSQLTSLLTDPQPLFPVLDERPTQLLQEAWFVKKSTEWTKRSMEVRVKILLVSVEIESPGRQYARQKIGTVVS